jgi:hypothetical protein
MSLGYFHPDRCDTGRTSLPRCLYDNFLLPGVAASESEMAVADATSVAATDQGNMATRRERVRYTTKETACEYLERALEPLMPTMALLGCPETYVFRHKRLEDVKGCVSAMIYLLAPVCLLCIRRQRPCSRLFAHLLGHAGKKSRRYR